LPVRDAARDWLRRRRSGIIGIGINTIEDSHDQRSGMRIVRGGEGPSDIPTMFAKDMRQTSRSGKQGQKYCKVHSNVKAAVCDENVVRDDHPRF